ncbi:hypothetical protein [Leucobacter sp. USHLN153]|uniref:hypothetical protein n=1 Tax=Leucobacter sp. USHLN153 TaxID=3081268 RepID=UPI0030187AE7
MSKGAGATVRRWVGFAAFLVVVALAVTAMMHRQELKDRFATIGYEASPRIAELATDLDLTSAGHRIFLATHPTVDGSQHFNDQCADVDHSEEGHVLGCYTKDRIHLFDVRDERVSGIVEVTAAHELLHAAFARLGEGDRALLSARLRDVYDELAPNNPQLAERMEVYEHLSDAAFANELHSVLGTEVQELPDWLEQHYAQWFDDRGALVDAFDRYHTVFDDLQDQAEALEAEMTSLRKDVERRKAEYDEDVAQFNADASAFTKRLDAAEFADDPDGLAATSADLEARRDALEASLTDLHEDIDHYNELRDHLQSLSEVSAELDEQLDSELAPITTRPDG